MARHRVLVVDDSATIRRIVSDVIAATPELEVAGAAPNGQFALDRLEAFAPDVVLLDVEMPILDGIATLKGLKAARPRLPVLMFSSHTEKGALATLDALAAGAADFVTKPVVSSPAEARLFVEREVVPRLRALAGRADPTRGGATRSPAAASPTPHESRAPRPSGPPPGPRAALQPALTPPRPQGRVDAIVIAISTGGPQALAELMPRLPGSLPVPVLLVQHMPTLFTRILADRLSSLGPLPVTEALEGDRPAPGHVYLAPGGHHLVVALTPSGPVLHIDDGPPENSCRPAADPLFRSAAAVWGGHLLAVVMTGMGRDGRDGAERVRRAGGAVIAQDKESSVVWGMPGAVVEAGLADQVLPLRDLALELVQRAERGRTRAAVDGR